MSDPVRLEQRDGIVVITVDHPPVNALSQPVRAGLLEAVQAAAGDPAITGIVLACAGRTFIAGADITEFGRPHADPSLTRVLAALEDAGKPVVAALHGTALGGGLELAMCCSHRVAAPGTRVGLPEVKLGLLPGAGGTQRLPRLLGLEHALEAILSGRMLAVEGAAAGVVDAVLEGELTAAATAWLRRQLAAGLAPRRVRELSVPGAEALPAGHFDRVRERVAREAPGQVAPLQIVACLEAAAMLPFDQGLNVERERFAECMRSPQSRALQHLFFAEREAAKVPGLPRETPVRPIRRVAVIGAGTMGGGIAMCFANAGREVTLIDADQAAAQRGLGVIEGNYRRSVSRGRLDEASAAARLARITPADTLAAAADADLVIEAVYENLQLKQQIFAELAERCRADAILATNTSTLDVDAIGAASGSPARVIGLHFFSPANVMRLLEIVRGRETHDEVLATCLTLARDIGKVGVVAGVCFGFIGNRMLEGYGREAGLMLLEGTAPEQIDAVITDFGLPMGPLAMGDLAGIDVGARVRAERRAAGQLPRDPRYGAVHDRLAELGHLGQKTGRGVYRYAEGSRRPEPDPEVGALIARLAEDLDVGQREIDDKEILERCLFPLVNEGLRLLEEGIAQRASDIDVVWVYGYGFPAWRGGPLHWIEEAVGLAYLLERLRLYGTLLGNEYGYWTPAPLLERLVAEGGSLADYRPGS